MKFFGVHFEASNPHIKVGANKLTKSKTMENRPPVRLGALVRRGTIALLALSTMNAATTLTFRNGVNGYSGAADASIKTQYPEYNGGNGVATKGDSQMGCYSTTGNGAYEMRYLLKFGNLAIPAGSQVVSATLTLSVESWN